MACCGHSVGIIGHIVGAGQIDGRNGQMVEICGHCVFCAGHWVCWIGHWVVVVPVGHDVTVASGHDVRVPGPCVGLQSGPSGQAVGIAGHAVCFCGHCVRFCGQTVEETGHLVGSLICGQIVEVIGQRVCSLRQSVGCAGHWVRTVGQVVCAPIGQTVATLVHEVGDDEHTVVLVPAGQIVNF